MPSRARIMSTLALKDVEELINAHVSVTGGGPGAPAGRQGAAISRAATVMVYAALEAFIEELFEEAADLVFHGWTDKQRTEFLDQTVKRFNNADVFKTNYLYFNIGIPWVYNGIRWQKFSNDEVLKVVNALVVKRNQIAHGKKTNHQVGYGSTIEVSA
jgi:hypothetical protein